MKTMYNEVKDLKRGNDEVRLRSRPPKAFSGTGAENKSEIETIRNLSEKESINVKKTNLTTNENSGEFSLNVPNIQRLDYEEDEGKISVISSFKGHTKYENDNMSVQSSNDLHGLVKAEKHGGGNIKSNIKLTAVTDDARYASEYIINSANDEVFDVYNGGYVKKAVEPLDVSAEKEIGEEIKSRRADDVYNETEKTELNRLDNVNKNTAVKKERLKTEVEAKVKQVVKPEYTSSVTDDFFMFLYKRTPENSENEYENSENNEYIIDN